MKPVRTIMTGRLPMGRQADDRLFGRWLLLAILTLGLVLGATALAYDAPPKDQGHSGPGARGGEYQNPDGLDQAEGGDPVQLASGNFVGHFQDLFLESYALPSLVQRTYNSQDKNFDGPLGFGWSLSYVMTVLEVTDTVQEDLNGDGSVGDDEVETVEQVILRDDTGVRHTFERQLDGSYQSGRGRHGTLVRTGIGAYTWTRQDGIRFRFSQGRLLDIADPNGNTLTAGYDGRGRLVTVTNPAGRTLTYGYGSNSKLSTLQDPAGRTVSYGYDEHNRLISVTNPLGHATTYSYDDQDRLTGITSPKGDVLVTNVYDDTDRVTRQDSFGGTYQYTYRDGYTQIRNPRGYTSSHYFNEFGNLVRLVNEQGYSTYYDWDDDSNLISVRDARNNTTTFEYDQQGNLVKITDPQDGVTTYTYDPVYNRITSMTDALGRTSTIAYDARANPVKITDPLNQEESFEYDSRGLLLRHVDKAGKATSYQYDDQGQLTGTIDRLGHTTTFGYDSLGRLVSVTDGAGNTTRFEQDALDRLTKETDPLNGVTSYAYDETNNLVSFSDPLGNTTSYAYDAYGRLTRITNPLGNQQNHEYDALGNLTAVVDPTGRRTGFAYDRVNLLTQINRPDGTRARYEYDGMGNRTALINPNNVRTTYRYDALNQLTQIEFADETVVTMGYDPVGRRVQLVDRKGQAFGYTFDNLDRLILTQLPNDGTITQGYDSLDNLVQISGYAGAVSLAYDAESFLISQTDVFDQAVTYEYDTEGRVTRIIRPDQYQIDYTYDAKGRLTLAVTPSGNVTYTYDAADRLIREGLPNEVAVTYGYDSDDNLLQVVHLHPDGSTVLASYAYEYDAAGMITSMTEAGGARTEYGYDQFYQLTTETLKTQDGTVLSTTTYTYDANGNRLTRDRDGTVTSYVYNELDELQSDSHGSYIYDDNGNLVTAEVAADTFSYVYDDMDRLESVTGVALGNKSYAYDSFGRRVQRSDNGNTERFVYDGLRLLESHNEATNPLARYDYGVSLIARRDGAGARYYHFDGAGNTRALTDASATVTDTYGFNAFGADSIHVGTSVNPFVYRGDFGYYNEGAGLHHVGARYLDQDAGRFIQVDPVRQGTNWYAYALNNPVNYTDPTGQAIPLAVWCLRGAASEAGTGALMDLGREKDSFWGWVGRRLGDAAIGCVTGGFGKARKAGKLADKLTDAARRNPCACLSEGTVVATKEGPIPIEDIEVGSQVASIDLDSGEHRFSSVGTVFEKDHEGLIVDLIFDDQTLRTTGSHPFLVISGQKLGERRSALEAEVKTAKRASPEGRWIESSELRIGDRLLTGNGQTVELKDIGYSYGRMKVFNLYVPVTHNFQISNLNVVSHNTNPCGVPKGADKTAKEVLTRKSKGGDGGTSQQIIERDASGNVISRTHKVTTDGKTVHQHQNHIGKEGGVRQFPDEWTGTKTINAPYENIPPKFPADRVPGGRRF